MNFWQRSSTPSSLNKWIVPLGVVAAGLTFLTALLVGSTNINIIEAISQVVRGDLDVEGRILLSVRLPRAIAACLAGGALAVSGAIIQAVLNNAMASPSIIGVNAGAGLGVTLLAALTPAAVTLIPAAAFVGATGACLLIYLIASCTRASRMTITLTGIAVSSLLTAMMSGVKALFPDTAYNLSSFSVGGLSGVRMSVLSVGGTAIAVGLALAVILSRQLDILSMGEETAHSLGMNVRITRLMMLILAGALAGCAVSFAGLLGFIGLVVPHILRRVVGDRHTRLIPACALFGGAFVLVCDTLSRVLFAPYEMPVGILLSLVGAPCFIVMILSSGKKHDRS